MDIRASFDKPALTISQYANAEKIAASTLSKNPDASSGKTTGSSMTCRQVLLKYMKELMQ